MVSVSPSCQAHLEFLALKAELVSNGNFLCSFSLQGIGIVFVRNKMQEKPSQDTPLLLHPVGRPFQDAGKDDAKIYTVTFITLLALCSFRDFRAFQPVYQLAFQIRQVKTHPCLLGVYVLRVAFHPVPGARAAGVHLSGLASDQAKTLGPLWSALPASLLPGESSGEGVVKCSHSRLIRTLITLLNSSQG